MKMTNKQLLNVLLILVFSTITSFFFAQLNTSASPRTFKSLSVTIRGDSYTAGYGAGMYYGPSGSYRSHRNWGSVYVKWLESQGVKATYMNIANSGHKIQDILDTQINKVPENTNLVMMTAGGNDAEFDSIVRNCFVMGLRTAQTCKKRIDNALIKLDEITSNTEKILRFGFATSNTRAL